MTTTISGADGGLIGGTQTWQVVTGSRALGTTYTNSTGKPIQVIVSGGGSASTMTPTVAGTAITGNLPGTGGTCYVSFIVPTGATYSVAYAGSITVWSELR